MNETAIYIILAGTLFLLYFSWLVSLREKRYHGIYRFFSFESILVLVVLQAPVWFRDPLSWNQLVSWSLLTGSLYLAVSGFLHLLRRGAPEGSWENTSQLVTSGIYLKIRHPLYLSLILLGFGISMKNPTTLPLFLGFLNFFFLFATARREEKEMINKFGESYKTYMDHSNMFFPFIL